MSSPPRIMSLSPGLEPKYIEASNDEPRVLYLLGGTAKYVFDLHDYEATGTASGNLNDGQVFTQDAYLVSDERALVEDRPSPTAAGSIFDALEAGEGITLDYVAATGKVTISSVESLPYDPSIPIRYVTATTDTLQLADEFSAVHYFNTGTVTVTVPPIGTAAGQANWSWQTLPDGRTAGPWISITRRGSGAVQIQAGANVTLQGYGSLPYSIKGQYGTIRLRFINNTTGGTWQVEGDLTPPATGGGVVAPANTVLPVISTDGTPTSGETVTVSNGTWSNTPDSYAFQWKRGATNVGVNSASYTLVDADVSQSITCVVTATNTAGSASATAAGITPTAPAVSGTLLWQDTYDHDADGLRSDFVPPWAGFARSFADRGQTLTAAQAGFAPRVGTHCMKLTAHDGGSAATSDTSTGPWSGQTSVGSRPPTGNPRAQLEPGNNQAWGREGQAPYYHSSIRIPSGVTLPKGPYFGLAMQWHGYPWTASPNFALNTGSYQAPANTLHVGSAVGSSSILVWQDSGPVVRDQWIDFTFLIKWSTGTDGYFEMWKNGVHQTLKTGGTRWTGQTLKVDQTPAGGRGGDGVSFYAATNYRDLGSVPGDVTYYFDAAKAGTTFDIVQP